MALFMQTVVLYLSLSVLLSELRPALPSLTLCITPLCWRSFFCTKSIRWSHSENSVCTASYSWLGISGHPRAGSFVRPSRPSDQPLSFVDALKKKYASKKNSEGSGVEKEIRISGKTVEEVGFEKKRRQLAVLQNLKVAVLDGLCIAGVESTPQEGDILRHWSLPPSSTSGTSPKKPTISLLDLSRNLLERWVDVESICSELKSLRTLQVKYVEIFFQ